MATGSPRCKETRFHDGHRFTQPLSRICTGMTSCGEQVHAEHTVIAEVESWCPGICDCGLTETYGYATTHGPGEHK